MRPRPRWPTRRHGGHSTATEPRWDTLRCSASWPPPPPRARHFWLVTSNLTLRTGRKGARSQSRPPLNSRTRGPRRRPRHPHHQLRPPPGASAGRSRDAASGPSPARAGIAATPLAHARATIVKLHGDYADLDQRNTVDELSRYPEILNAYLGRIFDEYGLIISGWSADWDIALVQKLEEARSRRYPLFWSSYGPISESARRLIALQGAVSLPGLTAESLFSGLQSRLEALDRLSESPITADIAVQRLKRALPDPRRRIELFDLVDGEVQRLAADVTRHPLGGVAFTDQLAAYEQESATSARLLATGVFHGREEHAFLWLRSLRHLMSARRPFTGSFNSESEAMRHYPALLCLWAMGVSAILAEHEDLVARLLLEPTWMPVFGQRTPRPAVRCLNPIRIIPASRPASGIGWISISPEPSHQGG